MVLPIAGLSTIQMKLPANTFWHDEMLVNNLAARASSNGIPNQKLGEVVNLNVKMAERSLTDNQD